MHFLIKNVHLYANMFGYFQRVFWVCCTTSTCPSVSMYLKNIRAVFRNILDSILSCPLTHIWCVFLCVGYSYFDLSKVFNRFAWRIIMIYKIISNGFRVCFLTYCLVIVEFKSGLGSASKRAYGYDYRSVVWWES